MHNRLIGSIKTVAINKAALLMLLTATTFSVSGCAAHYGAAKIVSSPSGAEVTNGEDDSIIGYTPVTMHWKNTSDNRKTIILKLRKAGYYDKTTSFWLTMRERNANAANKEPQLVEIEMQKVGE